MTVAKRKESCMKREAVQSMGLHETRSGSKHGPARNT